MGPTQVHTDRYLYLERTGGLGFCGAIATARSIKPRVNIVAFDPKSGSAGAPTRIARPVKPTRAIAFRAAMRIDWLHLGHSVLTAFISGRTE
jgi:hypothetical protein